MTLFPRPDFRPSCKVCGRGGSYSEKDVPYERACRGDRIHSAGPSILGMLVSALVLLGVLSTKAGTVALQIKSLPPFQTVTRIPFAQTVSRTPRKLLKKLLRLSPKRNCVNIVSATCGEAKEASPLRKVPRYAVKDCASEYCLLLMQVLTAFILT